jgi:hypothetical protein
MPGTWTSGVKRLRASAAALVIGVLAVLVTPAVSSAAPRTAPGPVTLRADHVKGASVARASSPTSAAHLAAVPAAVPAAAQGAPAATAGAGSAGGAVSGQVASAGADLSVDSVAAPPAVVPWIVVGLVLLVIAGAVKAYGRSRSGRRSATAAPGPDVPPAAAITAAAAPTPRRSGRSAA